MQTNIWGALFPWYSWLSSVIYTCEHNWALGQLILPSLRGCEWVPASAGKSEAGMVHSVSGWTRGVQVKNCVGFLRKHAIPERHRGVITTRLFTNSSLPLSLPLCAFTVWTFCLVRRCCPGNRCRCPAAL